MKEYFCMLGAHEWGSDATQRMYKNCSQCLGNKVKYTDAMLGAKMLRDKDNDM